MSLPRAYCNELMQNIDIDQAHHAYFAQPESTRRRLSFLCPDQGCRESHAPVITAVNYDKLPGRDRIVQAPHFRFTAGSSHSPDCPWSDLVEVLEELEGDGNSPKVSNLKRTELVTKFEPRGEDDGGDTEIDAGTIGEIRGIPDRRQRREALKDYLRRTLNKTSFLHRVAHCYERLTPDERRNTPLKIGEGKERTYDAYFAPPRFCTPEHWWNRIYHGKANVRRYATGYSVRFNQHARDGTARCSVSVFVTVESLARFRGGAALRLVLDDAHETGGGSLYMYVYGDVVRQSVADRNVTRIDVRPPNLHSLALRIEDSSAET